MPGQDTPGLTAESESPTPNQRIAKRSCPVWPSCGTKPRWSHPSALPGEVPLVSLGPVTPFAKFTIRVLPQLSNSQVAVGWERKIHRAKLLKRSKREGFDINASMAEALAKAAAPAGHACTNIVENSRGSFLSCRKAMKNTFKVWPASTYTTPDFICVFHLLLCLQDSGYTDICMLSPEPPSCMVAETTGSKPRRNFRPSISRPDA